MKTMEALKNYLRIKIMIFEERRTMIFVDKCSFMTYNIIVFKSDENVNH